MQVQRKRNGYNQYAAPNKTRFRVLEVYVKALNVMFDSVVAFKILASKTSV